MSISQPCFHYKKPIGISGVDLYMEDLVQDITYYNRGDGSYVFLVNNKGKQMFSVIQNSVQLIFTSATVYSLPA